MNDPLYRRLRESNWRRKLTPPEEAELHAWLAGHPEMESDWEAEAGLSEALGRLPDAPVPTNFTARLLSRLDALERAPTATHRRGPAWGWAWRWLLPRAAAAVVVFGLGFFSYERHQATRRAEIARDVATGSRVAAMPDPALLKDFEIIRRLGRTPAADEELLALLK